MSRNRWNWLPWLLIMGVNLAAQISDPYSQARLDFESGRTVRARMQLERIIEYDPECVECYDLLAQIATSAGLDSMVTVWYRLALAVEPENALLYRQLGQAEYRTGEVDSAMAYMERSVELNPLDPESQFVLGNLWFDHELYDTAATFYYRALGLDSTLAKFHFQLGLVYFYTDSTDSALYYFRQAYSYYPKFTQAYVYAARVLIDQQRWPEVITVLEDALASATETPTTRYWLAGAYVETGAFEQAARLLEGFVVKNQGHIGARYNFGIALYETGQFKEALEHLELVVLKRPHISRARLLLARTYNQLDLDSLAFVHLDTLLIQDSSNYDARLSLGDLNLKIGRYATAWTQYDSASLFAVSAWEPYQRKARVRLYQQDFDQAERLLDRASAMEDSAGLIYETMGDVMVAAGRDVFAAYYYGRSLVLDSPGYRLREKRAAAFARMQLWQRVLIDLDSLFIAQPERTDYLYRMALAAAALDMDSTAATLMERFLMADRIESRMNLLRQRIGYDPRNPKHYRALGLFYREQGQTVLAKTYFLRAVSLGDESATTRSYLEEKSAP